MLGKLKGLLRNTLGDTSEIEESLEHDVQIACAVLLIEAARADHAQEDEEMRVVERLLRAHFDLTPDETRMLLQRAAEEVDHAVALQSFTRQLVDALDERERGDLVGMLWDVVYADGRVDSWEEHLVRGVAELLYVRHSEFIRHKLAAEKKNRN